MAYTYKTEVWINDHNIIGGYGLERPLEYSIQLDGEEIYCGRDVALDPQEATNFTDIFEDYLECEGLAHLQETDYLEWEESAYRKFELYYNDVLQRTFYFLRGYDQFWDYSLYGDYMTPWQGSSQCLSEPINSHIDPRMKILHTDFKATTGETIIWGYVPRVTILTSKIEATAGKQTVHFTIDSNCNYSASTVGDWLIVRPIQATAGTKTFDVYLEGNSGETREGSVVISYRDEYNNLVTETIPVTQYQTHILYLNPETQTLPASAEDYGSIEVIADGPYFFGIEEDWLSIASISGSSGDTIYTIIPEINTQPSGRTAIITVGLNDYVTVSQEAASISVSPSTIIAQPSAGAYLFEVTSNIPFTATTTQGWITMDQTTGETGVTEIEVAVANYTGDTSRTAIISIGYLTTAVVVRQEALYVSVEPSSMTIPHSGGTFGFTVTANTDYTISEYVSWITLSAESGSSGITQFTFTAQPNPRFSYRSASISVGNKSLAVAQEPATIIVSPESLSFTYDGGQASFNVTASTDYQITASEPWLIVSTASGASGVSQHTVTALSNYGGDAKNATITVGTEAITVSQAADANLTSYFKFKADQNYVAISNLSTSGCNDKSELYYSLDGEWWDRINSGETINLYPDGQWVYLKGQKGNNGTCSEPPYFAIGTLPQGHITIAGNMLSVVYGDNFQNVTAETDVFQFANMRNDARIVDAKGVVLKQVSGENAFWAYQFGGKVIPGGFTGLETAPVLFTKTLKDGEYMGLFSGCTSLNYIKCLATDISASACTKDWVVGVAPLGLFVKAVGMNDWTVGVDGIPEGWIAIDEGGINAVPSSNVFNASGGVITVSAGCESDYEISTSADWVTLSAASGASGVTVFTATAAPSLDGQERTAIINIGSMQLPLTQVNYESKYLTFKVLTGGTINWRHYAGSDYKTISYSSDNGQTWSSITSSNNHTTINVSAGDKLMFKGDNTSYMNASFSGSTAYFNIEGNLMSLIYGDSFVGQRELTADNSFYKLFSDTNVVNAYNLALAATGFTYRSYAELFSGCTSLEVAPERLYPDVSAITIATNCFSTMFDGCSSLTTAPRMTATQFRKRSGDNDPVGVHIYMFRGCASLNHIECLQPVKWDYYSEYFNWTDGVASTGTFIKRAGETQWTTGVDGIPSGWTVEDA